ncbi:syntaxin [Trypanosoma grayi]|uniref:syntaxin n=1 Tax=Trypanosoma grayi TaxID=71804 RepID=UPI0004F45A40|nr:syntaxin [Trypanosoma grayi]KEG11697.1 syntaxin [Trypanosoma grayi]
MSSVHGTLRRLERLNAACTGNRTAALQTEGASATTTDAVNVDTSRMSAYDKGQYEIACCMKRVRENIVRMEDAADTMDITQRAEVSNSIRRDMSNMKKNAYTLYRVAVKEGRREDYNQLMAHINKTEQLKRASYGGQLTGDVIDREGSGIGAAGANTFNADSSAMHRSGEPLMSARDDEEFALFFEQTKKRDLEMDDALDRIGVGLTRLNENALSLQSELSTQQRLLDDTEVKVDGVHVKLTSMNARLRKTLKELGKDRIAMYVFCCILLIAIAGGIYFAAK